MDIIDHNIECTMVRACLIDENRILYNLDDVAKDCIGRGKVDPYKELAGLFGGKATRKDQIGNLVRAPVDLVSRYAKGDSRTALDLWKWQEDVINKDDIYGNNLSSYNFV